jgi:WD40 repeat protein
MSISVSHKMLAVAYIGQPITLWDLEHDTHYGSCGKKLSNGETSTHHVTSLVFNPNQSIELLAASYLDGELVLMEPFADKVLESLRADCHTLAASPDGRMLAGGAGSGTIRIYEFDTLKLLYQVKSSDFYIRQISFSRDGLRFADIRGCQCNIWEPPVLLRDSVHDDSSECTSRSVVEAVSVDTGVKITAMALHAKGEAVFCGKNDGAVCIYDLKTGTQVRTLYRHKSPVRILSWWPERDVLISIDASNRIFAWKLERMQKEGWVASRKVFQSRLDCGSSIMQLLPGNAVGRFILSTRDSDHLWTIDGQQMKERTSPDKLGMRKWIQHPESPLHMICFEGTTARTYSWTDWMEIASMVLEPEVVGLQLKNVKPYRVGHRWRVLLDMSELDGSADTCSLQVLDAVSLVIENKSIAITTGIPEIVEDVKNVDMTRVMGEVTSTPATILVSNTKLAELARRVSHIIRLLDSGKVVFLDTNSWVCSTDLEDMESGKSLSYRRHFFVPYDWFSGTRALTCGVSERDVVFARNYDVAIVRNGLEYAEVVTCNSVTKSKGLLTVPA